MDRKEKKERKKKIEVPVSSAQDPSQKVKIQQRSPAARSGDAIRVSAKDGESYAEILKAMKAKVDPQSSGAGALSVRRSRMEEILLVLKEWGDIPAFEKRLDQVVGQRADVKFFFSKRSLEVRDLDETVTREEVASALCMVARCFRCQGYGHVSHGCTLPDRKDACWRYEGESHVAKECMAPPRCLNCTDRGEKDVSHASASGFWSIFRAELRRLRGRN